MASLSFLGLAFYVVVLVGAFAVRSAAGFGAGLIAVPMLAFVLPVPTAVSVATVLTMVTSAQQVGRELEPNRLAPVLYSYVLYGDRHWIGLLFHQHAQ